MKQIKYLPENFFKFYVKHIFLSGHLGATKERLWFCCLFSVLQMCFLEHKQQFKSSIRQSVGHFITINK